MIPSRTVVTIVISTEVIRFFFMTILLSHPNTGNEHIDQLDSNEWHNNAANTVDPEIAAQQNRSSHGPVLYPAQRKGNQGNNDQGIENNRRQNRRLRRLELHDI